MGLDVYLYKYEDFKKYKELEKAWYAEEKNLEMQVLKDMGYNKSYEIFGNDPEIWGERDYSAGLFDETKYKIQPNEEFKTKYWALTKERKADLAEKLGYVKGEYGDFVPNIEKTKIEIDSTINKDHMFKIGYLRSSYNSAGTNTYLKATIGKDLYDIFNRTGDSYEFQPDWEDALSVTESMISELKDQLGSYGNLYVEFINTLHVGTTPAWAKTSEDKTPESKEQAISRYRREYDEHSKSEGGYSNFFGQFYHNSPLRVVAAIPGKGVFNSVGVYLVYTADEKSEEESSNWYLEGLEITKEMIEWVLAKPQEERKKYYLHWSG